MAVEPDETGLAVLVGTLRAAGCVFAEEEAALLCAEAGDEAALAVLTARRVAGEPLELVLGWAEFCGLRIAVEPGVFVPRRRTEFLARSAAELLTPGEIAVDLCCGAGAVGAALLALGGARLGVELHAADVDEVAVRCARRNLASAVRQGTAFVYLGDLDAPLPARLAGRVGVLAANVPYVPSSEVPLLPAEAREHEPLAALDGGADGLEVLRAVVTGAAARLLRPGGSVLIEVSERQQEAALTAFRGAGLRTRVLSSSDYETSVLVGVREAPEGSGASGVSLAAGSRG
jgi:release factor glutamine methyltransferase